MNFYDITTLNTFYSHRKYTEKDWVRLRVQHYPLQDITTCSMPEVCEKNHKKRKDEKSTYKHA